MTPAVSGSAPSPSPREAKAAPGLTGEAFLERIVTPPLLPLAAFTRDLPRVKLMGTAEWKRRRRSTMDHVHDGDTEKINDGGSKRKVFSVPQCLRGEMVLPSDF